MRIMQAVKAIGQEEYDPSLLADLIGQTDDMGQLARVIDAMGQGVAFVLSNFGCWKRSSPSALRSQPRRISIACLSLACGRGQRDECRCRDVILIGR